MRLTLAGAVGKMAARAEPGTEAAAPPQQLAASPRAPAPVPAGADWSCLPVVRTRGPPADGDRRDTEPWHCPPRAASFGAGSPLPQALGWALHGR